MDRNSQKQRVMQVLNRNETLTSMQGFEMGIVRVTNVINELRHSGINIKDRWETSQSGARYKVYWLDE